MDGSKISNEAWRMLLNHAESGLEDSGINESDFSNEDYCKIRDRAFTIVEFLRKERIFPYA